MSEPVSEGDSNIPKGSLDLGLSTLLQGAAAGEKKSDQNVEKLSEVLRRSLNAEVAEQGNPQVEKGAISEQSKPGGEEAVPQKVESPYKKLVEASNWGELSRLCEKRLAENNGKDTEATLWWLKGQLMSGAVPPSILAASLDSASRAVEDINRISLTPEESKVIDQHRQLASELLLDVAKVLTNPFDKELAESFKKRAERLNPGGAYLNNRSFIVFEPQSESPSSVASASGILNDKKVGKDRPSIYIGLWLGISLLLICLITSYYLLQGVINSTLGDGIKLKTSGDVALSDDDRKLATPSLDRVAGLGRLDALYYDMAKNDSTTVPADLPTPVAQFDLQRRADSIPTIDIISDNTAKVAANIPPQPVLPNRDRNRRETVNTQYPKEPRDRYERDPSESRGINQDLPEIDFPPYRSNKQNRSDSRDIERDGNFRQRYVIIARTKIMEEPSYWAYSLGDLYEGDKVEVEDNLGKWLKIHTRRGRVGYILAQDATRL